MEGVGYYVSEATNGRLDNCGIELEYFHQFALAVTRRDKVKGLKSNSRGNLRGLQCNAGSRIPHPKTGPKLVHR